MSMNTMTNANSVVVALNTELGWDNIVGVFPISMYERCKEVFAGEYHHVKIETIGGEDEIEEHLYG